MTNSKFRAIVRSGHLIESLIIAIYIFSIFEARGKAKEIEDKRDAPAG